MDAGQRQRAAGWESRGAQRGVGATARDSTSRRDPTSRQRRRAPRSAIACPKRSEHLLIL